MTDSVTATCHCGNIKITLPYISRTLTKCNCSICSRYASMWGYFAPEKVKVEFEQVPVKYQWGPKYSNYCHCPTCGCLTHYTPTEISPRQKVVVNFNMIDERLWQESRIRHFDGRDTMEYLD
ncbi:MAG: hypothetical protein V2I33_11680 [Kangiellaceae bacterium]|jgi:hypothetical protein|nr:hypothetical protein [Kangiellaceae bacterium]